MIYLFDNDFLYLFNLIDHDPTRRHMRADLYFDIHPIVYLMIHFKYV